jgi:hypothetical protein
VNLSKAAQEGLEPVGARLGDIEAIAVTTSSVIIDLSTRTNIYAEIDAGRLLMAQSSGVDVFYAFHSENSGSIDETNTTAGNQTQCDMIPAGARIPMRPPYLSQRDINSSGGTLTNTGKCRYLLVKAPVATTLRLSLASEDQNKRTTQ